MSENDVNLAKRAGIFALGMAILLYSIYTVIMSAAYIIGTTPMYFDYTLYNTGVATAGAISGFIGSLLIFLGWHAK